MKYGILLTSFKDIDGSAVCLARELESLTTPLGDVLASELDCPLYYLSRTIFTTQASTVVKAVSMAHECTETCYFDTSEVPRNVEREHPGLNISMTLPVA